MKITTSGKKDLVILSIFTFITITLFVVYILSPPQWRYRIGAELGMPHIQQKLGGAYYEIKDYEKAFKWYKLAADKGNKKAHNILGYMYQYGQGIEQDYQKAIYWYELAVEHGTLSNPRDLGDMYYDGHGVEQNYQKAFDLYKLSAEQRNDKAQNSLVR